MPIDVNELLRRQKGIGAPAHEVTQPTRPWTPTAHPDCLFCHVKGILDPNGHFVLVRVFKKEFGANDPTSHGRGGQYQYVGGLRKVTVWPHLRARHYRVYVVEGVGQWSSEGQVCELHWIDGEWYCWHPQLLPVSANLLSAMLERFGATSAFPGAFPQDFDNSAPQIPGVGPEPIR